ncbi:uncharacterized protein [Haliotis cracherodii]|uniref:uncharacterized protein isoform X1 n=1 Tax=Haliotis cracherodii TaxID=6455 RepID=UPI0039E73ADD
MKSMRNAGELMELLQLPDKIPRPLAVSTMRCPLLGRIHFVRDPKGIMQLLCVFIYWLYGTFSSLFIIILPRYAEGYISGIFVTAFMSISLLCLTSLVRVSTLNPGRIPPSTAVSIHDGEIQGSSPFRRQDPHSVSSFVAATVPLNRNLDELWNSALASSTHTVYQAGCNVFLGFLMTCSIVCSFANLPNLTEDVLLYFVTYCHYTLKLRYATIKTYLCGIRFMYLKYDMTNPWINGSTTRLETIIKAIKKLQGSSSRTRLPISITVLSDMCIRLNQGVFNPYIDLLMKTACCMAFFAFLRCGEFTCDAYNPTIHLSINSVAFNKELSTASVCLKASKTDPFRKGVIITLHRLYEAPLCCPVRTLLQYLVLRNQRTSNPLDPLFLMPNGVAMDRKFFIDHLKLVLHRSGYDHTNYNGHSFRIGAATTAATAGIPDHLIKTLGRWSSDCYNRYIRTEQRSIHQAQLAMAQL